VDSNFSTLLGFLRELIVHLKFSLIVPFPLLTRLLKSSIAEKVCFNVSLAATYSAQIASSVNLLISSLKFLIALLNTLLSCSKLPLFFTA